MAKTKIKVRDLKPKKDAKGGGPKVTGSNPTNTTGSNPTNTTGSNPTNTTGSNPTNVT